MDIDLDSLEELCAQLKPNQVYSTHYGIRFIRHILQKTFPLSSYDGRPNLKNFFFEIKPLVSTAKHLGYSHFVYFGHSYPFDGLLIDKTYKKIRFVECTSAFEGYKAELRPQHLITYNHAPLNTPLTNQKSKKTGKRKILYTPSDVFYDSELVVDLKNLIHASLIKKLNKYEFNNGILKWISVTSIKLEFFFRYCCTIA
ncbi:hypothetical protein ACD661_15145 [Legionella lytica]|uniref:Uncharacterized protein n=1 Tax=Legionella lytica TaxID=96232 RepID=A0ABW8DF86_9GAMM